MKKKYSVAWAYEKKIQCSLGIWKKKYNVAWAYEKKIQCKLGIYFFLKSTFNNIFLISCLFYSSIHQESNAQLFEGQAANELRSCGEVFGWRKEEEVFGHGLRQTAHVWRSLAVGHDRVG